MNIEERKEGIRLFKKEEWSGCLQKEEEEGQHTGNQKAELVVLVAEARLTCPPPSKGGAVLLGEEDEGLTPF